MTLASLIRKDGLKKAATATSATIATVGERPGGNVAEVASVAVAKAKTLKTTLQNPSTNVLTCFKVQGCKLLEIPMEALASLTTATLLMGTYILCFDLKEGQVYFTEDEEKFLEFQRQGKVVGWLHGLFEAWRTHMISCGLPSNLSIYHWALEDVFLYLKIFEVFPGTKIIEKSREELQ